MKDGVRELARQFKAFLQTREEDELTPLSSPQGGAEQTVPAATQNAGKYAAGPFNHRICPCGT